MMIRKTVMLLVLVIVLASCAQATPAIQTEAPIPTEAVVSEEPATEVVITEPPTNEVVPTEKPAEKVTLTMWSHWADQDSKKEVVQQGINDYMTENPDVTINIEWWDAVDMYTALQSAMTVGEGAPDILYMDKDFEQSFAFVDAGWLAPLEDVIDWSQMLPAAKSATTWKNAKGDTHVWFASLEAYADAIYTNPKIFEKLGIEIPDNYQFSTDEFYQAAQMCREGGYDPFGSSAGDRKFMGQYMYRYALMSKLGYDEFIKLWNGERSWDDPEVIEVLNWVQSVIEIPAMPDTYLTMGISEAHQYFHTLEKACMFPLGTWYTSRAFNDVADGGQPPEFRNGFLRYPAFPDGKGTNEGLFLVGPGYGIWSQSPNLQAAKDFLHFFFQQKYGNLWLSKTFVQSGIKTDPAAISKDDPHLWYFEAFDQAYSNYDWTTDTSSPCPSLRQAYEAYINDGLAAQLISVEEAIKQIEAARAQCTQ